MPSDWSFDFSNEEGSDGVLSSANVEQSGVPEMPPPQHTPRHHHHKDHHHPSKHGVKYGELVILGLVHLIFCLY